MSVIEGELEDRVYNFAVNALDRKVLYTYCLSCLADCVEGFEGEKTPDLLHDASVFLINNLSAEKMKGFAVRKLIEMYQTYPGAENSSFSSEIMKLGSTISNKYLEQSDDPLVRNFVTFLFSLTENSGEAPEGMPSYLIDHYKKVLCDFTVRALNEYCAAHNY